MSSLIREATEFRFAGYLVVAEEPRLRSVLKAVAAGQEISGSGVIPRRYEFTDLDPEDDNNESEVGLAILTVMVWTCCVAEKIAGFLATFPTAGIMFDALRRDDGPELQRFAETVLGLDAFGEEGDEAGQEDGQEDGAASFRAVGG